MISKTESLAFPQRQIPRGVEVFGSPTLGNLALVPARADDTVDYNVRDGQDKLVCGLKSFGARGGSVRISQSSEEIHILSDLPVGVGEVRLISRGGKLPVMFVIGDATDSITVVTLTPRDWVLLLSGLRNAIK